MRQALDSIRQMAQSKQDAPTPSSQPNRSRKPTALATWMRGLAIHLNDCGYNAAELFAESGLDYGLIDQADARYAVEDTTRLWHRAIDLTGDESIGLKAIRHIQPSHFHFVGLGVLASRNLEEVFERLSKLCDLITDASHIRCAHQSDGEFLIRIELRAGAQPAHASADGLMALLANSGKALGAAHLKPLRVALLRPEPQAASLDLFKRTFDCELMFDQPELQLVYRSLDVKQPLSGANATIAAHLDQAAQAALDRLKPAFTCAERVQALIESHWTQQADGPPPGVDWVASELAMSSRNLQRKLAEEGTSLADLLDRFRRMKAHQRLTQTQDPILNIALDLGFSDASAFGRACKRWFGCSPSQVRGQ